MVISDIIKRIFKDKKETKDDKIEEKPVEFTFENLNKKIQEEKNKIEKKEKAIINAIHERLNRFYQDVQLAIENLSKIDLSKRKEQEKIKLIVLENLDLYKRYLINLVNELKENKDEGRAYIIRTYRDLDNFNKTSKLSYEKATILVGKELEITRILIKNLWRDLDKITEEKEDLFKKNNLINDLLTHIKEMKENEAYLDKLLLDIKNAEENIQKIEKEKEKTKNDLERIKNSEDFKKDSKEKEAHIDEIKELEYLISKTKNRIDFKTLSRIFHQDKKKHSLIQSYSSNFRNALEEDSDLQIIKMLESQNLEVKEIKDLRDKIIELKKPFLTKSDQDILNLNEKIQKLDSEIEALQSINNDAFKKKERLEKKKENILIETKKLSSLVFE